MPGVIDCQGLGGHVMLGAVQAGFELRHRVSLKGGFGDEVVDANRHLLGDGWEQDPGLDACGWEPAQGSLLIGTPPCSGFSCMNTAKRGPNVRGVGSAINECMRELARYAGECRGDDGRHGPEFVVLESVQQAYTQGRPLMLELRSILESLTREKYSLTHVLMSGASVGVAQRRHRYFFVAHRIPFGLEPPDPRPVATVWDAIDDLSETEDSWDLQPYRKPPTKYVREMGIRDKPAWSTVDSCATDMGRDMQTYLDLLLPFWNPGEGCERPLERFIASGGVLEGRSERWWDSVEGKSRIWGGPGRLDPNKCGHVLTGNALHQFIHYSLPRFITAREGSRLMGLPDSWHWPEQKGGKVSNYIGKCCPVQSSRWLSTWIMRALQGDPGPAGEQWGDDEFMTNTTHAYKHWPIGYEENA